MTFIGINLYSIGGRLLLAHADHVSFCSVWQNQMTPVTGITGRTGKLTAERSVLRESKSKRYNCRSLCFSFDQILNMFHLKTELLTLCAVFVF